MPRGGNPGGAGVIGRGPGLPGEGAARLWTTQIQADGTLRQQPLGCPSVAREQLVVRALGRRGLEIENVGECAMWVDGQQLKRCRLRPGQLVEIKGRLLLLCERWPAMGAPSETEAVGAHAFGGADAHGLVGEGPLLWSLRRRVDAVGGIDLPVLIHGPRGSGKALIAEAIHGTSARADRPLISRVALESGPTPPELPPGRPSTAWARWVAEAQGTTLLVRNFDALSPPAQTLLVKTAGRGASPSSRGAAGCRLIATTSRPINALPRETLDAFPCRVAMLGLHERRGDIPLLVRHLLARQAERRPELAERFFRGGFPTGEPNLAPALMAELVTRRYKAHVTELDGLLERAAELSQGMWLERPPADDPVFGPPPSPRSACAGGGLVSASPPGRCGHRSGRRPSVILDPFAPQVRTRSDGVGGLGGDELSISRGLSLSSSLRSEASTLSGERPAFPLPVPSAEPTPAPEAVDEPRGPFPRLRDTLSRAWATFTADAPTEAPIPLVLSEPEAPTEPIIVDGSDDELEEIIDIALEEEALWGDEAPEEMLEVDVEVTLEIAAGESEEGDEPTVPDADPVATAARAHARGRDDGGEAEPEPEAAVAPPFMGPAPQLKPKEDRPVADRREVASPKAHEGGRGGVVVDDALVEAALIDLFRRHRFDVDACAADRECTFASATLSMRLSLLICRALEESEGSKGTAVARLAGPWGQGRRELEGHIEAFLGDMHRTLGAIGHAGLLSELGRRYGRHSARVYGVVRRMVEGALEE